MFPRAVAATIGVGVFVVCFMTTATVCLYCYIRNQRKLFSQPVLDGEQLVGWEADPERANITVIRDSVDSLEKSLQLQIGACDDDQTLVKFIRPSRSDIRLQRASRSCKTPQCIDASRCSKDASVWHNKGVYRKDRQCEWTQLYWANDYQPFRLYSEVEDCALLFYLRATSIVVKSCCYEEKNQDKHVVWVIKIFAILSLQQTRENKRVLLFEGALQQDMQLRRVQHCEYHFDIRILHHSSMVGLDRYLFPSSQYVQWTMRLLCNQDNKAKAKYKVEILAIPNYLAVVYIRKKRLITSRNHNELSGWKRLRKINPLSLRVKSISISEHAIYCLSLQGLDNERYVCRHALLFGVKKNSFTFFKDSQSVQDMLLSVRLPPAATIQAEDEQSKLQQVFSGRIISRLRIPLTELSDGTEFVFSAAFSSPFLQDIVEPKLGLEQLLPVTLHQ